MNVEHHPDHAVTAQATGTSVTAPPKDAPGELNLVRRFVNTVDRESGKEELGSPQDLQDWLIANGVPGAGAAFTAADLRRAVTVREALRRLLLANNEGVAPDEAATAELTAAGERARLTTVFAADGRAHLVSAARGIDAALGHLLAVVYAAMENGTWRRLKACRNDTCQWAFYDHSKNRSGTWCQMSVCGSQLKASAYRQRRKQAAEAP